MSKVWLITGCSSGFGRELSLAALARGDRVIATGLDTPSLEDLKAKGATTLALDVTWSEKKIKEIVAEAVNVHGRIDILFNNAGYLQLGAIEEFSEEEIQNQFNVNLFGVLKVTRAVLPYMRQQKSGVIASMGSLAGWVALPLGGLYCASKFAVTGLTLTLREEAGPFGVEVTVIEPGHFRTNVLGSGMIKTKRPNEELAHVTEPMAQIYAGLNGNQPGDPVKGAKLVVDYLTKSGQCAHWEGKPLPSRFLLGSEVLNEVRTLVKETDESIERWAELTVSVDFPKP